MKKWNKPELLNLMLRETESSLEQGDPYYVTPITGYCTACGKMFIYGDEKYNHRWIWTNFPFKGYYACKPGEEMAPPSDDSSIIGPS